MSIVLAVALGLGLAAAAGFRAFLPLFAAGIGARIGLLHLSAGFDWLTSLPALIALGTATVLEVGAYYLPWLDNLLDAVATPTAVVAGIVASAAAISDVPPVIRWLVAIIGGGGVAGLIQATTVILRVKSSTLTGGTGNAVLSTGELACSATSCLVAIFWPLVSLVLVATTVVLLFIVWRRTPAARRRPHVPPASRT